ncbi:SGNH/GDSL hydrolase family protein [Variovorax sp. J22R133]|uniref:SGNH/GDSL hydrolase family protein n=1 Tax=Variovorax brevis TaxID=3053503 RepID=UPI0025770E96|nr:SGNH/GDSL hydrolase family protein [Variovorax sp. J22R133]MDM0112005.1 SGNH/GDSL hydrolase family protein [Variovorax sp. J22R133]
MRSIVQALGAHGRGAAMHLWAAAAGRSDLPRRVALAAATSICLWGVIGASSAWALWSDESWVATWSAGPHYGNDFAAYTQFNAQTTLRQIVRVSSGGTSVRVRLSNEFGSQPLVIGAAHVGLRSSGAGVAVGSDRTLTFGGANSITIPAGAPALSDPVALNVPAQSDLAVSLYLPNASTGSTRHYFSLQTNYVSQFGDYTGMAVPPVASTVQSYFFLTAVDVLSVSGASTVAVLGDSITDGYPSAAGTNRRWTNVLTERLQAASSPVAVANEGISANRVLRNVTAPSALARFDRDVLAQAGIKYVIVLEGINDIGQGALSSSEPVTASQLIAGYRLLISRAHQKGLRIFGATLPPFEGAGYYSAEGEGKRQAVNNWIRTGGEYDGVIDFDLAIRDPGRPSRLLPLYDSGDHLHPSDAGYRAMGESVSLQLFK